MSDFDSLCDKSGPGQTVSVEDMWAALRDVANGASAAPIEASSREVLYRNVAGVWHSMACDQLEVAANLTLGWHRWGEAPVKPVDPPGELKGYDLGLAIMGREDLHNLRAALTASLKAEITETAWAVAAKTFLGVDPVKPGSDAVVVHLRDVLESKS